MSRYSRIRNKIWNSSTFHKLDDRAKLLWLYLLTCPHSNMLGLYVLKPGYALEDLGWKMKDFNEAFIRLQNVSTSDGSCGLISYDPETHLILIKNYFDEGNKLENPNQVKAAIKQIDALPPSYLLDDLQAILMQRDTDFYKPLVERLGKRFKRFSKGLPKPITVTVPVTVADKLSNSGSQALQGGRFDFVKKIFRRDGKQEAEQICTELGFPPGEVRNIAALIRKWGMAAANHAEAALKDKRLDVELASVRSWRMRLPISCGVYRSLKKLIKRGGE